jgi:hypothetical protein
MGSAVEHLWAIAFVKRSPNKMANWALASDHSRAGMVHSFSDLFKTKNSNFIAASSVGKWPRARMARRSLEFSASIAFVVKYPAIGQSWRRAWPEVVPFYAFHTEGRRHELRPKVGDGMKGKAAYRGGVQRLHFSTEGVIRRDRD